MTRVMVGDALVFEHERLIARMNQFFDRVESQLRQSLRAAAEAAGSAAAHRRRQRAGLGADLVRRRPPAALRPLGLQALARPSTSTSRCACSPRRRCAAPRVRRSPTMRGTPCPIRHDAHARDPDRRAPKRCSAAWRRCCRGRRRPPDWAGVGGVSLPQARRRRGDRAGAPRGDDSPVGPEGSRAAEGAPAAQHAPVRRRPRRQQRAADGRARHRQELADQGLPERVRAAGPAPDRGRQDRPGRPARHRRPGGRARRALHHLLRRPVVRRRRAGLQGA